MDYEPKLLKAGFLTLVAALAVVALLVLPGRVGAATPAGMDSPFVDRGAFCGTAESAIAPVIQQPMVIS